MRRSLALVVGAAIALGCGTGAPPAGGSDNLPSALVGPFRVLRTGETTKTAPHVLDASSWDEPSALDLDGDPATVGVALYVVSNARPRAIVRFDVADDQSGPKAEKDAMPVLTADAAWEDASGGLGGPFAIRVDREIWLYYASGSCIGRARSADGRTFTKDGSPALCGDPSVAWEDGEVAAPSVHRGFDGTFRMLYASGGAIGEAASPDGAVFHRVPGPVLARAAAPADPVPDGGVDPVFDDVAIGDPHALVQVSPLGRPMTYLFFTARDRTGTHAIGLAARVGDDGPFSRNPAPALARLDVRAPTIVRRDGWSMLYAAGSKTAGGNSNNPAVIAAVAPASLSLPIVAVDAGTDAGP